MEGQLFLLDSDERIGTKNFARVIPRDAASLAQLLAPRIRQAYFNQREAEERLRSAVLDLSRFSVPALEISDDQIATALEEELDAVLPAEWKAGRPKQTATQRSELAEIIAADVMSTVFQTKVPASRIADKEIPDQQTRGVDVLGLENLDEINITLIIAEVKGSSDLKSPPGVVTDMASKLRELAGDRRRIIQELTWLRDHCDDAYASVCARLCAGYLLGVVEPKIIMNPVLIRTASTEGTSDHGIFKNDQENFDYPIRFVSVIIEAGDLFEFAVEVYREARRLAEQ
jgi:Cap4 SAVED domain